MGAFQPGVPANVTRQRFRGALLLAAFGFILCEARAQIQTVPGMPPVPDPNNLYSETGPDKVSPSIAGHLERVYVPHVLSNDVYVIDPQTFKVVDKFKVGLNPQHVVPSWDLQTLWVTNNAERTNKGSLTPIDPATGKPGTPIDVADPYNMYFSPDGRSAIVVAEALKRLDFREPQTMALQYSIATPGCAGINHGDFAIDGSFAIFTCEFSGGLAKIDLVSRKVMGYLKLSKGGMPQDIRVSPDGAKFYVADMHADGIFVIDAASFIETGFIDTGKVEANWPVPGGGSPDMGNVSADGRTLWLSGRYDNVVYAFDTTTGEAKVVKVGIEPHGLAVWPQPGRYSLGHTGNMR